MKTRNQISLYKSILRPFFFCPLLFSAVGRPLRKNTKNSIYNIYIYKYIMFTHTHSDRHSQEKKKNKSAVTESSLICCFFIPINPQCSDRGCITQHLKLLNPPKLLSFLTICSVINKLCASGCLHQCKNLPSCPFKRFTHPYLYSFCGLRRNKWFNTSKHTHTHTNLQDSSKRLHSAMAVFFFFVVKTNVYKNASICAISIRPRELGCKFQKYLFIS